MEPYPHSLSWIVCFLDSFTKLKHAASAKNSKRIRGGRKLCFTENSSLKECIDATAALLQKVIWRLAPGSGAEPEGPEGV